MTFVKRFRVLAAKIETTPGTAEALTASEAAFNAYDIEITNEIEVEPREGQGSFGYLSAPVGGYRGRIRFKTDVTWDGTATEPSWADTFLPMCGWVKSGQTFYPISEAPGSNVKTGTFAVYTGTSTSTIIKSLRGCAGTFQMVCPTGKKAYFEWDFTGIWIAPADGTQLAPTYPTVMPLRYATSTTTFNSVAFCPDSITLDAGNEIYLRECPATVSGYESAIIVNRMPKVTTAPEQKLVATQDRTGIFLAGTEAALTWGLDGPTTAVLTATAPKAQIISINDGDRGGLVIDQIEFCCNKNGATADQEVSLTFTNA